jgi:hypothetical protein
VNKTVIIAIAAVVVIGGGVAGAAMMGLIQIPGLSPAKKKAVAAALYAEEETKAPAPKVQETPTAEEPLLGDIVKGRKELAKLWNEMEAVVLVKIVEKWDDGELAHQLRYLDVDKTAEILALLKPDRASEISKRLQQLGAVEPPVKA